jgi:hypothetical protein
MERSCLIKSCRQKFNQSWTPQKFARFRAILQSECGEDQPFRHSETPCFFPASLIDRIASYGVEMVQQLLADSHYTEASRAEIPEAYRVPDEAPEPLFVQADFGLDQNLEPKLVEIQGFPSLYSYQPVMADAYREAFNLETGLASFPGGLHAEQYWSILHKAIVGDKDPENVILLEIDPWHQKTRHDFLMTRKKLGVHAVDIRDLRQQGNRLFYPRAGSEGSQMVPVDRIYNRTIIDELQRRDIVIPFDLRDDIAVEWAGHPNWFFRLSKFSLPYLKHPAVPRTEFLDRAGPIGNPQDFVLKPLYSFAGVGVIVGPSREQLDAIPVERRKDYILQERVNFQPVIETPFGMTKVEIRIMYIWGDAGMQPVNTIIRMGRGAQMGVDFNKGYEWIGASAAFTEIL